MAKHAEIVKYEAAVDKAATAWTTEATKAIAQFEGSVQAAAQSLRGKITAIPVPKGAPATEFAALENSVNGIIAKRASGLKITVKLHLTVDAKAKSLAITGMGLGYPILKS